MTEHAPDHFHIEAKVRAVELLISNLLRIGVVLSISIIIVGSIVGYVHHPEFGSSKDVLPHLVETNAQFPHTVSGVINGLRHFQGQSIILLGLVLLIATPIMRVAISILAFVYQRDRVFVMITTTVLILLILSFLLGKVE